jgi:hypothetical protein
MLVYCVIHRKVELLTTTTICIYNLLYKNLKTFIPVPPNQKRRKTSTVNVMTRLIVIMRIANDDYFQKVM